MAREVNDGMGVGSPPNPLRLQPRCRRSAARRSVSAAIACTAHRPSVPSRGERYAGEVTVEGFAVRRIGRAMVVRGETWQAAAVRGEFRGEGDRTRVAGVIRHSRILVSVVWVPGTPYVTPSRPTKWSIPPPSDAGRVTKSVRQVPVHYSHLQPKPVVKSSAVKARPIHNI